MFSLTQILSVSAISLLMAQVRHSSLAIAILHWQFISILLCTHHLIRSDCHTIHPHTLRILRFLLPSYHRRTISLCTDHPLDR